MVAAANLAVSNLLILHLNQNFRVKIGALAPRPPVWVMYTTKPPTLPSHLATVPRQVTLRPPWWTIPEADRLQMHEMHADAFARPSTNSGTKSGPPPFATCTASPYIGATSNKHGVQGAHIVATAFGITHTPPDTVYRVQ